MKKIIFKTCCASCMHKQIQNDGSRLCELEGLLVESQHTCEQWEVNASMVKTEDRGMGKVKRHEYLMFVLETRTLERQAVDEGTMSPDDMSTLDSLRKRFEEETGLSPFLIL